MSQFTPAGNSKLLINDLYGICDGTWRQSHVCGNFLRCPSAIIQHGNGEFCSSQVIGDLLVGNQAVDFSPARTEAVGNGNDSNPKEDGLELKPFLDKFFYIEGLLSNNLRMSLTGSEINHPNKASNTVFNNVKNPKKVNDFVSFNKVTGESLQTED